jgi:hypothetical protein
VTTGINNSTPVAGGSCDIVGWYDIDAVVHGFWAAVPPPGSGATSGRAAATGFFSSFCRFPLVCPLGAVHT